MKKVLLLCLICACIFSCISCGGNPDEWQEGDPSVTLTIECTGALAYRDTVSAIPENGMILMPTEILLCENETIYDILLRAQRLYNIAVETQSGAYGMYVTSIGSLAQGTCTSVSGWTYAVNGTQIWDACNDYVLKDGDSVTWSFVTSWE